jgi:hypothetical protein
MVLEVFGNILFYPGADHLKEFPSPEELKGRVLLSTKPPKEYLEAKVGTMKEGDADPHPGKGAADDAAWGKEVPDFQTEIQSAHKVSIYIYIYSLFCCLLHFPRHYAINQFPGDNCMYVVLPSSMMMVAQITKGMTTKRRRTTTTRNRQCTLIQLHSTSSLLPSEQGSQKAL